MMVFACKNEYIVQGPKWSTVLIMETKYTLSTLPTIYTRLAYAVWMLQKLIEAHSTTGSDVYVMYDIACSLSRHLQVCLMSIVL